MTTYNIDFLLHKVYAKLPPINPKENGIIYSSDNCLNSTYNDEYSFKDRGNQTNSFKPSNIYQKNDNVFNSQSTYSDDFVRTEILKQKSLKPIAKYSEPTEKFYTDTNYNSEFTEKKTERSGLSRPVDSLQPSKSHDETMMSNYRREFVEVKAEKPLSYRPAQTYKQTEQKEQWETNYKNDFIKTKERPEKIKNFKPISDYKPPEELFSSLTNYTSDFEKFNIKPSKSYKPVKTFQPPEEPLTSRSLYNEEFYSSRHIPKVHLIRPQNQINIGDEEMVFETDYSKEFYGNPHMLVGEKSTKIKPIHNYDLSNDSFTKTSSYGDDFTKVDNNERVKPFITKGELEGSDGKW